MITRAKYQHTMENDGYLPPMVYRLDAGKEVQPSTERMESIGHLMITNGPAFSPDGKKFYVTSTIDKKGMCYDYDLESGLMSNGRQHIVEPRGTLDGNSVDTDGNIWWNIVEYGKCTGVDKFNGETGRKIDEVDVGMKSNLTHCFGGPDFKTMLITSSYDMAKRGGKLTDLDGCITLVRRPTDPSFHGAPLPKWIGI